MRLRRIATWIGAAGVALATQGCVVHDGSPVNPGYGYGYAYAYGEAEVTVGEPAEQDVSDPPPDPLDDAMTPSPGADFVWLDGYWHWNGEEWVWVGGRWEQRQPGYVYVQPSYDYSGGHYSYTPGYWSRPDRIPPGWRARAPEGGRPTTVEPPPGWHHPISSHPVRGSTILPPNGGPTRDWTAPPITGVRPPVDSPPQRYPIDPPGVVVRPPAQPAQNEPPVLSREPAPIYHPAPAPERAPPPPPPVIYHEPPPPPPAVVNHPAAPPPPAATHAAPPAAPARK